MLYLCILHLNVACVMCTRITCRALFKIIYISTCITTKMSGLTGLVLISVCASLEENGEKTQNHERKKNKIQTTTN